MWYIGTLVPVIGLIQAGSQAMADRYTYLSLIGLFIMIAWGVADLLKAVRYRKIASGVVTVSVLLALLVCTRFQVGYWQNNVTLYEHALAVTKDNYLAHNNLGAALTGQGKANKAIEHYRQALQIYPRGKVAVVNLGKLLIWKGQVDEAIGIYRDFLQSEPNDYQVHKKLADALVLQEQIRTRRTWAITPTTENKLDEALEHYKEAIRLNHDYFEAHHKLAEMLDKQGNLDEAIKHYREALRLNPDNTEARRALNATLNKL